MKYFQVGVWSNSYSCLDKIPRNKTHCGCYFIAVILTVMNFISGGKPVLCKSLFGVALLCNITKRNAVITYYLLSLFGTVLLTDCYRVWVLHLSLIKVFIQSLLDFLLSVKIIN